MKLRKLLCLMVVLALALTFVLAGCQKAATEPSGEDTTTSTPDETGETVDADWPYAWDLPADTVELTWYVIGATEQEEEEDVEAAINDFLADKINATVDLIFQDYDPYQETMGTRLNAGEAMDIVFTSGWASSPNYRQSVAAGLFTELNGYLQEGGILYGTRQIIGDDFMNATQMGGKNYAIPCNKEQAHNWGFLMRTDIVDELDLDIQSVAGKNAADALDALEPILAKVHETYPEMIPLVTATGESCFRLLDWDTFSGDCPGALYPDNRDTTVINQYAMPESKAFYDKMHEFYLAGYIRPDADTYSDWQNDMDAGLGFCVSQSMKPGKDVEYSQGSPYEWTQVDVTAPVMSNREADGSMMAIPVTSENPDRAAMLLELANTDKWLNNTLNYGLEGVNYTKVSDNVIELTDDAGYRPNVTWVFPNQFMNYTMSSEDPDKFVNFIAYNQSAMPTNSLGFFYDGSEMKNEIDVLSGLTAQYTDQLNAGTADVDKVLADLLEALDNAGAADVIAHMQAQFDAWLANQ